MSTVDEHDRHGRPDGCLDCEVAWLGLVGSAAGQLVAEVEHAHRERAAAEEFNLRRRAYREGRWPHRVPGEPDG